MNTESRLSNKICPEGMSIEEWQVALRQEQAEQVDFFVEHLDNNRIWGDYAVISGTSKYKVAFRGVRSDRNYCSCLDFRTNGLGTCKHLEAVILYLRSHIMGYPWADMVYNPPYSSIYVRYKGGRQISMRVGEQYTREFQALKDEYFSSDGTLPKERYADLQTICQKAEAISSSFRCYEDVFLFASEVIGQQQWQEEVRHAYPQERIPYFSDTLQDAYQVQEHLLYKACYIGYGLLVGYKHRSHATFVARLAEVVYLGEEMARPGFILLHRQEEVVYWRTVFNAIPSVAQLPIEIDTLDNFVTAMNQVTTGSTYSFVYVDDADCLKEWKNRVSIAIKRIKINHLYMRVDTLELLGSVQLSSILQHISPFVIGPFYKFIHTYRPLFPLKDDGSNFPEEVQSLAILIHELNQLSFNNFNQASASPIPADSEDKVKALIHSLQAVLADPIALQRLSALLVQANEG